MMNHANKFFIINDVDRPERRHVMLMSKYDGRLLYMHPELHDWGRMEVQPETTTMEEFGFHVSLQGDTAIFSQINKSLARYKDGSPRMWQDVKVFSLPMHYD